MCPIGVWSKGYISGDDPSGKRKYTNSVGVWKFSKIENEY